MKRSGKRESEFHDFYTAEAERLRRYAVFLVGDLEEAADLTQETLVKMYRHWGRVKSGEPAAYARRVLLNLIRSRHRRRLIERKYQSPERETPTSGHDGNVDDWLLLSEALAHLSPVRRATIVLRFYEDMSEQQIAEALDRNLGTVKSDIHRGLAKLRELLTTTSGELR